jgi:hypothetical protein
MGSAGRSYLTWLAAVARRSDGDAIEVTDVMEIPPGNSPVNATAAERRAFELMRPAEDAGLARLKVTPLRKPPTWWELTPAGREAVRMPAPGRAVLPEIPAAVLVQGSCPLVGPIEPGEVFAWEPDKPHARELLVVVRIEERPGDERLIHSRPIGASPWGRIDTSGNDESRFREACWRTIYHPHPPIPPLVAKEMPESLQRLFHESLPGDGEAGAFWRGLLVRYMAKVIDAEEDSLADRPSPGVRLSADDLARLSALEPMALELIDRPLVRRSDP